jgi:uncharacterized membrane protein YhaH (DUF805 family)
MGFEQFLDSELKRYNGDVAVSGLCFLFCTTFLLFLSYLAFNKVIGDTPGFPAYISDLMGDGLNLMWILLIVLFIWVLLNTVHSLCLGADRWQDKKEFMKLSYGDEL